MPDKKPWYKRLRFFWIAGAVVIIGLAIAVVVLVRTQAAPPQPYPYNHAAHIAKGIPCLYCHSGAERGRSAGLPTVAKCQGCHANMNASTPGLKAVADYLNKNPKIQWVPVAIMPDFVYFSHQPHIAAGLNCEACHGDVGSMQTAQPRSDQNMGWCLTCHKNLAPDHFVKLSDCATCHK